MASKSLYDREDSLRLGLNNFLSQNFELPERDYYSCLSTDAFLRLKSVLADINNILTLRVSLAFVEWVAIQFGLDAQVKLKVRIKILKSKPNANGFDIWLDKPVALVGEVKCNIPINEGSIYGSAQRHGIENDITAMLGGKRKSSINPQSCLKFLVFLDRPEIRCANEHLLRVSKICKDKLVFASDDIELTRHDIIYGVYVVPMV